MRILLDTHVALWAIADSPDLPAEARKLILSAADVYVSAASIWEISIKHGLGRGNMPLSGAEATAYFEEAGYLSLPITAEHAVYVEQLPPHHADPFDRILAAQAICEPMRLVTHDAQLARYSDTVILV
jgi:PIN domain nuclease of toxin-antitoxin system